MGKIQEFVDALPIVDAHEHHIPEILLNPNLNLLQLFQQSYAGWTQARPYPLPSESRQEDPMLAEAPPANWEALAPFLERSGSNSFVRNLVKGLVELYAPDEMGITRENWRMFDEALRARRAKAAWRDELLKLAKVDHVITDPYTNPLLNARGALGPNYHSVVRINAFAFGWNATSLDHNGNSAWTMLKQAGLEARTFEDYLAALEKLVERMPGANQVGLKNALAYDRDLHFGEPNEAFARAAWGKANPMMEERKAFSDFVADYFCKLAAKHDLPVQMHLGSAIIRGSHPLNVAPLIERHPRTRFLLMHLAYPWSRDLLAMAFVYRNIWIDLTWSWLLSPSHFKLALHEAIEILPDDSRMMLGGDNWHIEETFATLQEARRLIGEVLEEKVVAGYFGEADATRLAGKILNGNAREFFKLP